MSFVPQSNRNGRSNNGNGSQRNGSRKSNSYKLSPQQIAVIAGLLTNALTVESVLIDKDQRIEIILEGSLRRRTQLDRMIEEMSHMSVGDLIDALLRR